MSELVQPRFSIGDPVMVRDDESAPQWCFDWRNVDLWIVGVRAHRDGYSYEVVEKWPPCRLSGCHA